MNIGIIGTGIIGETVGGKWLQAGHEVVFGTRDPDAEKIAYLLDRLPRANAASISGAIDKAEVILLALPGTAVAPLIDEHKSALQDKVMIDATNQIGRPILHNIGLLQEKLPQAPLFRAFNSLGWEVFADPFFGEEVADHFFCGSQGPAKDMVAGLIADIGLRPIYVGGPEAASLLDGLSKLWFALALDQGYGRRMALRMLTD